MNAPALLVRRAKSSDLQHIEQLLRRALLPLDGVAEHFEDFVTAWSGDTLVGVAGLERHGSHGLLRSVAVDERSRAEGLGKRLTEMVIEQARAHHLRSVSLLTTTAETYFPRFGFVATTREALPVELRASKELQGACPASSKVLTLALE